MHSGIPTLLVTGHHTVTMSETTIPAPGPGELLVETAWSCISPGTEGRCLAGKQHGAPAFPYIPGYSMSGVIRECGPDTAMAPGTRVFCSGTKAAGHPRLWGGHISLALADEKAVIPVPDSVGLREASGAKLAAISHHGLRLSHPLPGNTVFVIGLGPIGRFSAQLHAAAGARVIATDLSKTRRDAAENAGIEVVDPAKGLKPAFDSVAPGGADIVVDTTGSPPVLVEAAHLLRDVPWDNELHASPKLVIQGSYASMPFLPYDSLFLREAQVLIPRDSQRRDIAAVLDLMARGRLDLGPSVADGGDPAGAHAVYESLRERPDAMITAAFRWGAYSR